MEISEEEKILANRKINLEESWLAALGGEFAKPYMQELRTFLVEEKKRGKKIFPKSEDIFKAMWSTPFSNVKVIILGQDPYHGIGQAHGLSFSVPAGIPTPPSLQNIFKELYSDLSIPIPNHGCLEEWAKRGVLLLNAVLTVEQNQAASHQNRGWEIFTDSAIKALSRERNGLVFLLWGSYAAKKRELIDEKRHLILTSPHPSPLSAYRGFLGNRHFSKTNSYLASRGVQPVDWTLPSLRS